MCRGTQLGPRFLQAAKYGGCAIPVKAELQVKCIRLAFWGVCRHFQCPKCGGRVWSVVWLLNDLFSSDGEMFPSFLRLGKRISRGKRPARRTIALLWF